MSVEETYGKTQEHKDDCLWQPFAQYTEPTNTYSITRLKENDIKQLFTQACTDQTNQQNQEHLTNVKLSNLCTERTQDTFTNQSKKSEDPFICECFSGISKWTNVIECKKFGNVFFGTTASKEYWEQLLKNSLKKKSSKRKFFSWKQSYLKSIPLNESINLEDDNVFLDHNNHCKMPQSLNGVRTESLSSLTSDESDDEDETQEISRKCDPIYSQFGEIRDAFHTSEDGIVFDSQRELDKYKQKMAEMRKMFHFELELIKHQHDQLRAKRAEERKLLSAKMSSSEQDAPEIEPTEKDALNSDNHDKQNSTSKQERKSALFSSFHDAFSYARTGIQGMFVKNSPNGSRKVRTNDDYSDSSDEEEEKLGTTLLSKNPEDLQDFHDEFTRKMTTDGGLVYKSSDMSDQQLSYQNLPPPLSLVNTLSNKANN